MAHVLVGEPVSTSPEHARERVRSFATAPPLAYCWLTRLNIEASVFRNWDLTANYEISRATPRIDRTADVLAQ